MKKVMKKALSCFLAVAMVFSILTPAYAAEPEVPTITMTADTTKIEAGETVSFEIAIDKSYTNLNDYQFNLYFDPDLFELTATEKGPACTNTDFGVPQMDYTDYYPGETYVNVLAIDFDGLPVVLNAGVIGTFTFTAKEDVAGEGLFKLVPVSITDYDDFSNVAEDLDENHVTVMVGTPGVAMPEGAPFTAITTDAGDVIAVEQQEDVYGVPYYIVTIPEDAETAYVTAPDQVVMEDWNTGEMQATAYAYEIENGWNQLFISYNYEESEDGPIVEIPMYMVASDWSGEVELCFVEDENGYLTHAFGIEDANFACQGIISFRYGEENPEQTYRINVEQTHGGTVTVDKTKAAEGEEVFVSYEAATGYRFKNFKINGVDTYLENGILMMPAEDVVISAVFEMIPVETYAVNIQNSANGTVTADKAEAAAGEAVTLTVMPADGYVLDTLTVMSDSGVLDIINNTFTMPAGEVTVSATFRKMNASYSFATSADLSAENGDRAVVSVKVTGHTDSTVTTYNAYDITLTFDSDKLEFVGYDGAVKSDNGQVKVEGNTIRIVGCGDAKEFGTAIASLTFNVYGEGFANVTVTKAQLSDRETAVDSNIPEASAGTTDGTSDETPGETIIKVPYSVTKPGCVGGADHVLHGEDYTFWYTDTDNYSYTGLSVTVGGVEVTVPPADDEGKFVIENVEGSVVITVTQTPNSYAVDFDKELVDGDDTAIYGTDYEFSVILGEGQEVESVTVLDAAGNEIPHTYDSENGKYIIAGGNISGAFSIVAALKDIAATETTITFDGVEDSEVEGGLVQTAKIGKAFSFKLNKDEKFTYSVLVGDTELTEKGGEYTIPADLVAEGGVVVTIIKEAIKDLTVDVSAYINLDGKTMFLVTAKWDDHVLSYNGETMYYSDRYNVTGADKAGAYCWLVISTDEMNTVDQVKAAAEEAITVVDGVTVTVIGYDYDVNETTQVDVNDAQLAYDMYNASYMEFTEHLPVLKFLEADVSTDGKLDVQDVASIINHIVNK